MSDVEERLRNLEKRMGEIERKIDVLLNMLMSEFYEEEETEFPAMEIEKKELN